MASRRQLHIDGDAFQVHGHPVDLATGHRDIFIQKAQQVQPTYLWRYDPVSVLSSLQLTGEPRHELRLRYLLPNHIVVYHTLRSPQERPRVQMVLPLVLRQIEQRHVDPAVAADGSSGVEGCRIRLEGGAHRVGGVVRLGQCPVGKRQAAYNPAVHLVQLIANADNTGGERPGQGLSGGVGLRKTLRVVLVGDKHIVGWGQAHGPSEEGEQQILPQIPLR